MEWKNYIINQCLASVYYIPDFITPQEESYLLSQVDKTPKPRWTQLSRRRLINYGGVPHPKGMIAEPMPSWLQSYVDKINQLNGVFEDGKKANHVLVNEYLSGQGIMPHSVGPLFHPTITTISCGSHTVLEFHEPQESDDTAASMQRVPVTKLFIEQRSLLILKDDMYNKYLHSIAEVDQDVVDENISNLSRINCQDTKIQAGDVLKRKTRISFTIRHVPKTSKMKIKLF
ncbi:alpha-ketoglutarate-dependent dioxygenase alkB homolog 6 [Ochlerotatus camptorhynchus]|uniref:alpha-ketoglutarate-dependent dioxygenase alkB homolog 6 n=1 Tax=Ochlerotatus camptorhynchus TaxID=644619 RepID=UPI0031DACD72